MDRQYNTAAMLAQYYGPEALAGFTRDIAWNVDNPNDLSLPLPGGGSVATRVTRRSQAAPAASRLETSEYLRQTFESPSETTRASRVKASQCFVKYKWRSAAAAEGGPEIVATQARSRGPEGRREGLVNLQPI